MSVKDSAISMTAALLFIAVGVFVLFAGLAAGVLASDVAGAAFIALGVILYRLLFRFTKKVKRELDGEPRAEGPAKS